MLAGHPSLTIEEVTSPRSHYLAGMNRWLELIFPEYCPPRFAELLARLRPPNSWPRIQIFVGLIDGQVAGLAQVFYRDWQGGLVADLDLLGVLEPFRRSGLALALVRHALQALPDMARRYQLPAIGLVTLIDPHYDPIVRLHRKQRGQIREDYTYPSGDLVVWYPLRPDYSDIPTPTLGRQLYHFGQLLAGPSSPAAS